MLLGDFDPDFDRTYPVYKNGGYPVKEEKPRTLWGIVWRTLVASVVIIAAMATISMFVQMYENAPPRPVTQEICVDGTETIKNSVITTGTVAVPVKRRVIDCHEWQTVTISR